MNHAREMSPGCGPGLESKVFLFLQIRRSSCGEVAFYTDHVATRYFASKFARRGLYGLLVHFPLHFVHHDDSSGEPILLVCSCKLSLTVRLFRMFKNSSDSHRPEP